MALILNIDTAVQAASICLADDGKIIATAANNSDRESAAWLQVAIKTMMDKEAVSLNHLNAVAVSSGPGSYTGLRIGMATAKGLCYALSIPLLPINTLQLMAASATEAATQLLCPMIDARRMEVFTSLYDRELNEVLPSTAMILEESSFKDWLMNYTISFFGNGSNKALPLIRHKNAVFINTQTTASNMVALSVKMFTNNQYADLAYTEPFYGKQFYSPTVKKKH